METDSGADANGCGGVTVGNKTNGVGGVGEVSAVWNAAGADGDTTNGGVGNGKASFVPKTNSSERFALLGTCVNAPVISLNTRLYSFPEYEAG